MKLNKIINTLKQGKLIIYPTETCYGLGADATNPQAVQKLLDYKGERGSKPISVAVADQKMAEKYVVLNETARHLYRNFLPGPLTVISKSKNRLAPALQAGGETLGIRIPDYSLVLKLISQFGRPITATSANTSGKKPPYSLADWQKYTSKKKQSMVDLFWNVGRLTKREPSTVVDTTLNETTVLRQGAIQIIQPAGTFISNSEAETQKIAQKILSRVSPHRWKKALIFALQGELGAGKTQFAKGLAASLGIKTNITSPTFNIIKEYPFDDHIFYHLDTWRLEKGEELLELGLKKMIAPGNFIAIEWLQKVRGILETLKAKIIWVTIEILSPNQRKIKYQTQLRSKPSPARRGTK